MTFLEAKKIVEQQGYRIAKNIEGESFRERVAREELEEAKRVAKRAGYQIINEDVDNRIYGVDIYYNPDNDFPDFDNQEPNETVSYTFDQMIDEFGTDVADDIVQLGSCDSGNGTYYKLAYIENTDTGERIPADELDFSDLDEGCCGAGGKKKKGKKKKLIKEDAESAYETALMDKDFTDFIDSISNNDDYDANEEKYASWVDELVENEGWDVIEAIDHVISKNWDEFRDEIINRAMDDDYSAEEAERIADLVATPISGITYEEVLADPSLFTESCCGSGKKKKGKKKGKKSEFVPFWAKKKDGKLNEDFGDSEGTTFTSICQNYVSGGKFFAIVAQVGLQGAIEKVLADVKTAVGKGIGDKYYNTFAARLRQSKSPTDALYKISNAMLAGENMDSAAGTRQSAYNRNRGVGRGRR